ncbi:hypothetical protein F4553_006098 [Allocatelliglobosispora scoriae]|uniref:Uncharacterized protein n=1 Tax=Allocatelliglobosispora scoriae TaxID=643052 RepID=A0A841BWY1_9ACTN|nr:hypothetical protein [Allocatelliglobosispora scoriae]MBB5872664.1 hypothetical protein [Allocatelliglobosispora scoriae]
MFAFLNEVSVQFVTGVIASIFLLPLIRVFSWLTRRRWRSHLRDFFGINGESRGAVQIKVSCIPVIPRGTVAVTDHTAGFNGNAITEPEYQAALVLTQAIQAKPLASFLRAFAEHLGGESIDPPEMCQISLSPPRPAGHPRLPDFPKSYVGEHPTDVYEKPVREQIEKVLGRGGTTVLIGSNVYNLLTDFALRILTERDNANHVVFYRSQVADSWERGVVIRTQDANASARRVFERLPLAVETPDSGAYTGETVHTEYFVIQRLSVKRRQWPGARAGTVFVCAGNSSDTSALAVETLAQTWKSLHKEYGDADFTKVFKVKLVKRGDEPADVLPNYPRMQWASSRLSRSGRAERGNDSFK